MKGRFNFNIGKKSLIKLSLAIMFISGLASIMFYFMSTGIGLVQSEIPGPKLIIDDPVILDNVWSKKIIVYNDDAEHYYNVPVSTSIPENLIDVELYRYLTPDLKKKITDDPNYKFEIKDTDDNGKSDTVSWIVPELSEVAFSVEGTIIQPEPIQEETKTTTPVTETRKIQQMEATGPEIDFIQNPYDCSASNVNCTLTTVTIDNGDGSITMINYQKPVNFFNSTLNDWQAINMTIIPGNFDGYDYGVEQEYQIYYRSQISAGDSIKYCDEGYCFTTQPSKITYRNSLGSNDDISQLNTSTIGTATDNKFGWNNTFTDCDLEYMYGGGTHKEYILLKQKPRNPAGYLGDVSGVTFDVAHYIKFPAGVDMYVNDTIKTDDFKTSERIEFRNESNVTLFYLPKPIAFDSNETTLNSINLVYDIVWDKRYNPSKERLIWFYIQTPYSWLNETAVYPVYIEPSVAGIEYNTTVDVYHLWNERADYYVNATSGIQITNHFQEYWTQNQICAIFYWGASSHEYCAGNTDWTWYNTTDWSTFSNLTGTTTARWAGHEWDITLEYYLESNWSEIKITPTFENKKNRNYDKAELRWMVHDIRVKMTYEDDFFYVNDISESGPWNLSNASLNINFTQDDLWDREYTVEDANKYYISTRWNESYWKNSVQYDMNYTLNVTHNGEYNAPINLIMNFEAVAPSDIITTNFWWRDPSNTVYAWVSYADVSSFCSSTGCTAGFKTGGTVLDSGTEVDEITDTPATGHDFDFEKGKYYRVCHHWNSSASDDITDPWVTYLRADWKIFNGTHWVPTTSDTATTTWDFVGIGWYSTDGRPYVINTTTYEGDYGNQYFCDDATASQDVTIDYTDTTEINKITWDCTKGGAYAIENLGATSGDEAQLCYVMYVSEDTSHSGYLGRSTSDASTCKPEGNTNCVGVEFDSAVGGIEPYTNYFDAFENRTNYTVSLICDDSSCAGNPEEEYNLTLTHLGYSVTTGTAPTTGKDVLVALNYSSSLKSYIQNGNATVITNNASRGMGTLGYVTGVEMLSTHAYYGDDFTDVTTEVSALDDTYASRSCSGSMCATPNVTVNFTTSETYEQVTIEWKVSNTDGTGSIKCWDGSSWSLIPTAFSSSSDTNTTVSISTCDNSDGNYTFVVYGTAGDITPDQTIYVDYIWINGSAFESAGTTNVNITDSLHPVSETYSGDLQTHIDGTGDSIWYVYGFIGRTLGINSTNTSRTTVGIIDADKEDTSSATVGARVVFVGDQPATETGKFLTWDGKELFLRSLQWAAGEGLNITKPNNKSTITVTAGNDIFVNFTVWDIENDTEITSGLSSDRVDINTSSWDCSVNDLTYDTDHWKVNCTTSSSGTGSADLKVGINITNISTSNFTDRDVEFGAVVFAAAVSYLEVNLTYPPIGTTNVDQNTTFNVNATITCKTGSCSDVFGTIQYNLSTTNPETPINNTAGHKPFYNTSGNILQSCGSMSQDDTCQLNWTINATGDYIKAWKIGVLFNSSDSGITDNHTDNATIKIIECWEGLDVTWTSIDWGDLESDTDDNAAPDNDNNLYNLTNIGTCTLKVWLKGTNLQNTTLSYPNLILAGNLTWSNTTNDAGSAHQMTTTYTILNESFTSAIRNVTTYYWLTVPRVYAGRYNGTMTFCENTSQSSGNNTMCT